MTPHTWVDIPSDYASSHSCGGAKRACWTCGKFEANLTPANMSCEQVLNNASWLWGPGMYLDPFKTMRAGASNGLGTNPWGASQSVVGLPPRQEASDGRESLYVEDPKPEDIPGITPEEIDKEAYDEFMRGL